MRKQDWAGVFAAVTTPFRDDDTLDESMLAEHVRWLLSHRVRGIVALGSLGEGATLSGREKIRVLEVCRSAAGSQGFVIAGVSGLATRECVELARAAAAAGCDGLMVLPPYVYRGDWRETEAHFSAVIEATSLSCMLYNNPIAYGTDLTAADVAELARHPNVHAVKESSGDVRRLTALRAALDDRLALFAGLDDMIGEAAVMGAEGWIAGLVNALPQESVTLFELASAGERDAAVALYRWFLPLLRFDVVPKFVQLIKLVQSEVGMGSERVRAPRLPLTGTEREAALGIIRDRLARRPRAVPLSPDP
ncbi:MAG TPA: dihydrodipicolinate synthase family protein [Longimicrobiales bacterium]|nr:dihydrodipicolinate synthase family protein [Longimicrobiales bacterium]